MRNGHRKFLEDFQVKILLTISSFVAEGYIYALAARVSREAAGGKRRFYLEI